MDHIYSAVREDFSSSENFISFVLSAYLDGSACILKRTQNGKPYLEDSPLHLSLTHTKKRYFLVVSKEEIGIDAEPCDRCVRFSYVADKYFQNEKFPDVKSFLRRWTAAESAVKLLGGTLAYDLKRLQKQEDFFCLSGEKRRLYFQNFERDGHILSICKYKKDFSFDFCSVTLS